MPRTCLVDNVKFDSAAGRPAGNRAPGFVALATPDGRVRMVADDLAFPHGRAVTAGNSTLIAAHWPGPQRLLDYTD